MRLVIVDDEPIVLEGLGSILAQHDSEFSIAAMCGSGDDALAAVRALSPDIVITDIRMNGMSGLELAEEVKAFDERIVVILLTGYSDFAFAQKALRLDVFEYLVKPTRHEDILSCLRRAAKKRARLLGEPPIPPPPLQGAHDAADQLPQLVRRALSSAPAPDALTQAVRALSLGDCTLFVLDILMEPLAARDVQDAFALSQALCNIIPGAFPIARRFVFIPEGIGGLVAVAFVRSNGDGQTAEQMARGAGTCVRSALDRLNLSLVVGLSSPKSSIDGLHEAYTEASSAKNSAARSGHSFSAHANKRTGAYSPPIKKALSYIQAHYADGISLKAVSAEVFLNTWYFSELFKKEVGQPFTDYILSLRIARAKQLIVDKRLPLYQISSMVGINSPTYFSQVFKKATGLSPKEYRKKVFR